MYRGTTPTNKFMLDIDLQDAVVIYITYKQNNKTILEKTKEDIEFGDGYISVELTQEETLEFKERPISIQIRARFADGKAIASNIIKTTVNNVLKEGAI